MAKNKKFISQFIKLIKDINPTKKQILKYIIIAFFIVWVLASIYAKILPLPTGISFEGSIYNVSSIDFMYDLNYVNDNKSIIRQEIFDEVFRTINLADKFIVIDMFLFNTDYSEKVSYRNLTTDMKNLLVSKKIANPDIQIVFITDPINNFYGDYISSELQEMADAGIDVIQFKASLSDPSESIRINV